MEILVRDGEGDTKALSLCGAVLCCPGDRTTLLVCSGWRRSRHGVQHRRAHCQQWVQHVHW
jgi:hypothetical protein